MKKLSLSLGLVLLGVSTPAWAHEICPAGESMATRLVVTKPSRLENLYKTPEADENGNVTLRVFENDEWIVTPAQYKWIDKPEGYVAPATIINREITDMSGRVVCFSTFERRKFYGEDKIVQSSGSSRQLNAQFMGSPIYSQSCDTRPKTDPVTVETEIPYDPEFWEKGNKLRVVVTPARMKIRQAPAVKKLGKVKPEFIGQIRHPAELKESDAMCRRAPEAKPELKMVDVPTTSWSVIYLKGYDEASRKIADGLERVSPHYDLSDAVLTTSVDPKSLDIVWQAFDAPCNPVGNHGLNERGEPKLDASGNREWTGKATLQVGCTDLFIDHEKGETKEMISARGLAEMLFEKEIGPSKTYHLVDLTLGVLIWYNEDGEEIARFERIDG